MHRSHVLIVVFGLMISAAAIAQSKNDGTAMLSGTVIGGNTAISVYLQSTDENPTRYYDGYKSTADKNGSFLFIEIKPGTYRIRAEASGFISTESESGSATLIKLQANETRGGVKIFMLPVTSVCGRVTENGSEKRLG